MLHLGNRWASAEETAVVEAFVAAAFGTVADTDRDIAVAKVVDRASPWLPLFEASVAPEWGVGLNVTSTVDMMAYRDTAQNWPVEDGYGALVARHTPGIPIELSTPVREIDWRAARPRVVTDAGTIAAEVVIVTVSTSVLAAESIRFRLDLPVRKRESFAGVQGGICTRRSPARRRMAHGAGRAAGRWDDGRVSAPTLWLSHG